MVIPGQIDPVLERGIEEREFVLLCGLSRGAIFDVCYATPINEADGLGVYDVSTIYARVRYLNNGCMLLDKSPWRSP